MGRGQTDKKKTPTHLCTYPQARTQTTTHTHTKEMSVLTQRRRINVLSVLWSGMCISVCEGKSQFSFFLLFLFFLQERKFLTLLIKWVCLFHVQIQDHQRIKVQVCVPTERKNRGVLFINATPLLLPEMFKYSSLLNLNIIHTTMRIPNQFFSDCRCLVWGLSVCLSSVEA